MEVETETAHPHHRSGHRLIDLIVPVAALFVSLLSILIAYSHGKVMKELVLQNERLVQANSLPHVSLDLTLTGGPGGASEVRYTIANKGVGPAQLKSTEFAFDGRRHSDVARMLADCCGIDRPSRSSTMLNSMMRPGETLDYLIVRPTDAPAEAIAKFGALSASGAIDVSICYCSVFGECWTVQRSSLEGPKKVNQCPVPVRPAQG